MLKHSAIFLSIAAALSGCSTSMQDRVSGSYGENDSLVAKLLAAQRAEERPNTATSKVPSVYLGSKGVPFKSDLVLPEIFRRPTNFIYPGESMTLAVAVERISRDSGIPIRISQDVYSVRGKTAAVDNVTSNTTTADTPAGAAVVKPPLPQNIMDQQPGAAGNGTAGRAKINAITLNTTATPSAVLDQICLLNGLNWEYRDGTVIIQRLVTRSFTLKVAPGQMDFDFQVGKNASSQAQSSTSGTGTISTGFTTNSTLKRKGTLTPMESVKAQIAAILTEQGTVVDSPASGSLTVIDTIDGVDRAKKIIDRENEILTRNATFRIELISFKQKDADQGGLDLNILFQNLGKLGASISSPASLVSSTGATVGLNVISGSSTGRFDGSQAFLRLLNEVGTATTLKSLDIKARNRSMTPAQFLDQQVYLAKTTPASSTSVGGTVIGTPGLEPGTITTGLDMKLQPNILDSNQISLVLAVGMVDLVGITQLTSGTGINQQSIEAPQTSGFEFQYDVNLEPGKTAILSGYERVVSDYTRRRLGRDVPTIFGGSYNGSATKERVFILVTPIIESTTY